MSQNGSYAPQNKANFALIVAGLPQTERLILSMKSAKPPAPTLSKKAIKYFNQSVHYAGSFEPQGNVSLAFHDYLDADILATLSDWFRTVFNPAAGAINLPSNYKKQGELILLPPGTPVQNGFPEAVDLTPIGSRVWDMQGLWPVSLDYDELDHDSDDNCLVRMELSVDVCVPRRMNQ